MCDSCEEDYPKIRPTLLSKVDMEAPLKPMKPLTKHLLLLTEESARRWEGKPKERLKPHAREGWMVSLAEAREGEEGGAVLLPDFRRFPSPDAVGAQGEEGGEELEGLDTVVLVCAHAKRDKRCGVIGAALVETLRARADERTRVFGVSHVGGHKFAGHVLVYTRTRLKWYARCLPRDVPAILRGEELPEHKCVGQIEW